MALRVKHINILADWAATNDSFPHVSEANLAWEHRCPMLLEHLMECDADVVVLVEVD